MGWHTATQRSAASTIRKSEEVIWLMEVEARYSAHTAEENGHSRRIMVLIRRGNPEHNHLYPHVILNRVFSNYYPGENTCLQWQD